MEAKNHEIDQVGTRLLDLTKEEITFLLNSIDTQTVQGLRDAVLIKLAYETQLTLTEITVLIYDDVIATWEKGRFVYHIRSITDELIPIEPSTWMDLLRLGEVTKCKGESPVFTTLRASDGPEWGNMLTPITAWAIIKFRAFQLLYKDLS